MIETQSEIETFGVTDAGDAASPAITSLLRALSAYSSDLTAILDAIGVFKYVSPSFMRILGYRPDSLIDTCAFDLLHPDERPGMIAAFAEGIGRPQALQMAGVRVKHANGHWRWLELVGHNRLSDPVVQGVIINGRDVTEQLQMEEALRGSEARLAAMFNALPDMCLRMTSDGRLLDIKAASDHDLRTPREAIVGRYLDDLVPTDAAETARGFIERAVSSGVMQVFVSRLTLQSGVRDLETRLIVNGPNEVLAIVRDVTEQKQAEAARAETEAARRADRLKSELLCTVSHELRTPLGAIKGFATMLLDLGCQMTAEQRIEAARMIDQAADRLNELVDNLLQAQRLEAGMLEIRRAPVDLLGVIREVVDEIAPTAERHSFEVIAGRGLPWVEGDERRLRQLVHNLADNAIKYSPDGGCILVSLAQSNGDVEVRVSDPGVGIPSEHLDRVFERFHRVDNSSTRRIGGTGLGLAIARMLVEAHGGRIWAESAGLGKGSKFVVALPALNALPACSPA